MSDRFFVDTNLFIYANTKNDAAKHDKATAFFGSLVGSDICVSTQVVGEMYSALRKYLVDELDVQDIVYKSIADINVLPVDIETVERCFELKNHYGYSYWDSLILSAAILADCRIVYSEDMSHGQIIDGVLKIFNPFA